MSQAVMYRWQAFVQKVTGRFQEILAEAHTGFDQLLADPNLDPYAYLNAFSAIELRCKDLGITLSQTYSTEVAMQLGALGQGATQLLQDTEWWMFEQLERFRSFQKGRLVRIIWPRVQASMQKSTGCKQCGGPLTRHVMHQAESVKCHNCGVLNSITPEPIVYTYFAMAPDLYAEEQTIESRLALERAERMGVGHNELLQIAERHWQAFVDARSTILLMNPQERHGFVQSRLSMIQV